jgi:hypothetical protein
MGSLAHNRDVVCRHLRWRGAKFRSVRQRILPPNMQKIAVTCVRFGVRVNAGRCPS